MPKVQQPILCVASHNVMQGLFVDALLPHYQELLERQGLDILCIQENLKLASRNNAPAGMIAESLGSQWKIIEGAAPENDNAILYQPSRLILYHWRSIPLPKLNRFSRFERLWVHEEEPLQRSALFAVFHLRNGGAPFAVVSFHLDAAGGTNLRERQIQAIADALMHWGFAHRFVACGDTNAITRTLRKKKQIARLKRVLAPLRELTADDPGIQPTHRFGRMREQDFVHRACVVLGKIGIDLPQRYDVIATNMSVILRGQIETPTSDHDLVWAKLALS